MIAGFRDFQVNRILTGALMLIAFCGLSFSAAEPEGQDQKITKANYDLAARFAPEKVAKMVFDTSVEPRWLEKSDRFWYSYKTSVGRTLPGRGKNSFEYTIDKNSELAKNLKGRLLLVTGDIDNNVHPAGTLRVANALIKANKHFDLFILPGIDHGYPSMFPYLFWLAGDYFCRHLIGDSESSVDILPLQREVEAAGEKKHDRDG
jgi:hypothetical protein